MTDNSRLTIYVKSGLSRGKAAAAAVHAALLAMNAHPGTPVIVLGANNGDIESRRVVVRDHGKTEVEPGTMTAGTDFEPDLPAEIEVDPNEITYRSIITTPVFRRDLPEDIEVGAIVTCVQPYDPPDTDLLVTGVVVELTDDFGYIFVAPQTYRDRD